MVKRSWGNVWIEDDQGQVVDHLEFDPGNPGALPVSVSHPGRKVGVKGDFSEDTRALLLAHDRHVRLRKRAGKYEELKPPRDNPRGSQREIPVTPGPEVDGDMSHLIPNEEHGKYDMSALRATFLTY